ncbi:MAG TPA: DNA polymerase III subunit alpha [Thermoanaerobaculia bacterium]|jgi:DNA polymerase-3 subunit alpha|nr:DNA polymerase III subunit alpha [Thermoanaerobaculia bacterium]
MSQFVHLHLHSQYSLLDGANRLDDVLAAAATAGQPAMALTDHGNMFGAVEFYKAAKKAKVKPIIGIEAYMAQGSRLDKSAERRSSNHLVLLAKNETGYRNLLKLTTSSFLEGYYYKPRIDRDILARHAEGLICLSACLNGEINEQILGKKEREAEAIARTYKELFGDDFFLELQDHGIPEQRLANDVLRRLATRLSLPMVVTNDAHYLRQDDAFAHDVLLCIGTQKTFADPDRLKYASNQFYVKTAAEMHALFPDDGAAVENTVLVAERCQLSIPMGEFHLPRFPVPEGESLDAYLATVARQGLDERLAELRRRQARGVATDAPAEEIYRERLERELEVIVRMGFPGYFLVVWDFCRHARDNGIPVGPGRGSAAGSLVSYSLRITDVDPLQYGLLFERFLNPDRISMPDIDIDFCMRRRGEVINYVSDKYGRDKVAQIITFGTLAARAVIRDVGRVMGLPYGKVDRVAKMVPEMTSLPDALKTVDALQAELRSDPEVKQVIDVGLRLEGLSRHAGMHAAGVVIAPRPIQDLVPLCKTNRDEVITQWDKDVIEELGLLKMDFLGLRTLTVIDDTLQFLRLQGIDIDLAEIPLDDPEVYRLFQEGRTNGIFQFESSGMKDMLRRAGPTRFMDLSAFNALYRPGALSVGMVEEFIKRKRGEKKVQYILPETKPILEETYGVIAYQEQVMRVAVEVAGFTMAEADVLRKAMGKKKLEVMLEQKAKFVAGAKARGKDGRKAEQLWDYIEPFAGYGFNKSHSVAYALLAYQTAYLKAHHPVAFMAAMLTSEMASKDNVAKYMQECRGMGIAVLPPAVNESNWTFTVLGDTIRFGLGAVKGLGEGAVEAILAARKRVGRFRGVAHLAVEVDEGALNRKVFECLIKAGAFDGRPDEPGFTRAAALQALDGILAWAQRRRDEIASGQGSLFAAAAVIEPAPDPNLPEWSESERLRNEKETLGFYLTGSPLSQHEALLAGKVTHNTSELIEAAEQEGVVAVAGVVARVRRIKIKSGANAGRLRALFSLEDEHGSVAVSLFADMLQKYDHLLQEDAVVLVRGNVRMRTEVELTAQEVVPLSALELEQVERLDLVIGERVGEADLLRLRDALAEHAGELPVRLTVCRNGERVCVAPAGRFKVRYAPPLVAAVEAILGAHSVVPVLQEPASFVEEPDDLLPAADELEMGVGEIEAEALVS